MNIKTKQKESYFINKYNALDGKNFRRKSLEEFHQELYYNLTLIDNTHLEFIYKRISKVLEKYPKQKLFNITIKNKLSAGGLNDKLPFQKLKKSKLKKVAGLGLPYFKKPISVDHTGLNKSVSSSDIYDMVTNKVIELIKTIGKKYKFKKGWSNTYISDYLIAYNFITKKPYTSINQLLLSFEGLENPYFLTFKQIEKLKGKIVEGSKAYQVVYYTILYKYKIKNKKDFGTYDINKLVTFAKKQGEKVTAKDVKYLSEVDIIPIIKYYNVFNGADTTGIDFDLDNFNLQGKLKTKDKTKNKKFIDNPDAESIIKNYPKPQPILVHKGNKAFHQQRLDGLNSKITMPPKKQFNNEDSYYKTLFHEYSHSTGIKSRLNRVLGTNFGSKTYAFEELIAELSALFLSNEIGIIGEHFKNGVAYIKSWNKALIKELENDNKFILKASAKAQKSANFILQRDKDGVPLYLREKGKITQKNTKLIRSKDKKENIIIGTLLGKQAFSNGKKVKTQFKYIFKKPVSENTLQKHTSNAYGDKNGKYTKLSDIEISKIYAYNLLANYLQRLHSKNYKHTNILVESGKPIIKKLILKEIKNRKLIVSVDIDFNEYRKQLRKIRLKKPTKHKGLKKPISQLIEKSNTIKLQSANQLLQNKQEHKHYDLSLEFKKILGDIEIKQKDSVAITIDAPQGAMKTRLVFQVGNEFSRQGLKVLFVSLEEHPTSKLFQDKLEQYVTPLNQYRFYPIGELENGYKTLSALIPQFDVIIVDSWNKIAEDERNLDFDKDLRKKFDGKLFITIFQRTSTGTMRGGSKSQFDGDVILKIKKFEDYKYNYVYQDKNRYMVGDYIFNIYEKITYDRLEYLETLEEKGIKPIN